MNGELTISLPAQEMQLVWNAVMELPGKFAYTTAKKIESQLGAQGAFSEAGKLPPAQPQSEG